MMQDLIEKKLRRHNDLAVIINDAAPLLLQDLKGLYIYKTISWFIFLWFYSREFEDGSR